MIGTQLNDLQSIRFVYTDRSLRQRFIGELYPRLLNSSANPKLDPNGPSKHDPNPNNCVEWGI